MYFYCLELSELGNDVTKCYEQFYTCMEKSAVDTANEVFIGDRTYTGYHGWGINNDRHTLIQF